jgi:small acid-soluble spore protein I (minor)
MNISIREYIKNNFKDNSIEEIKESIIDSIAKGDELVLPGLGVFFETLWNNSENKGKDEILNILKNNLKKK